MIVFKTGLKCEVCGNKSKIFQDWKNIDFSGIQHYSNGDDTLKIGFCSKDCKTKHNKYIQKQIPYLAELDRVINYCQYFQRENGNEGFYIRDNFKYKVSGLWDWKTTPKEFIEAFKKHFNHTDYYKLHNRYK